MIGNKGRRRFRRQSDRTDAGRQKYGMKEKRKNVGRHICVIIKKTNERTNERTNKRTNAQTNKQTNKRANKQTNEQTNKQTTGKTRNQATTSMTLPSSTTSNLAT